jgi:hypothetical protein
MAAALLVLAGCDDDNFPDLGIPDLSMPDLAMPDLLAEEDLAEAPDLTEAPDLLPFCTGTGAVDVNQTVDTNSVPLQGTDVLAQTFTVGRTGNLDGIGLEVCPQPGGPAGNVTITVFNGSQSLGAKTIATSALSSCPGLTRFAVGCIPVTQSMSLRFEMTTDIPVVACPGGGICPGTGLTCTAGLQPCVVINADSAAGLGNDYSINGVVFTGHGPLVFSTYVE